MKTWSSIGFIIGSILSSIGLSLYYASSSSMPPFPMGWVVAVFFLCFGAALILSSIMFLIFKSKRATSVYIMFFFAFCFVGIGVRLIVLYPYNTPECTCPDNTFGTECTACNCVNGICDDGYSGSGNCMCNVGWDGILCNKCASTFTGEKCDRCKHGWTGETCDRCFPGYVDNCDTCDSKFLKTEVGIVNKETNAKGFSCEPCLTGWGGYCLNMPNCKKYDKKAVAKNAVYWKQNNLYDPDICTSTTTCNNRYDCDSFNCRGVCVEGDNVYNRCDNDLECQIGRCEYKTCCEELRYGDGTCECKTPGYFGPLCEKCPGFDDVSVCSGHGTCTAMFANEKYSHLECDCVEGWSGTNCECFGLEKCTKCADGYYGSDCKPCPGGTGVNQCNGHGTCNDGINGDGTCSCDQLSTYAFKGQECSECYSSSFQGEECEICAGGEIVGYNCLKCTPFKNNFILCN